MRCYTASLEITVITSTSRDCAVNPSTPVLDSPACAPSRRLSSAACDSADAGCARARADSVSRRRDWTETSPSDRRVSARPRTSLQSHKHAHVTVRNQYGNLRGLLVRVNWHATAGKRHTILTIGHLAVHVDDVTLLQTELIWLFGRVLVNGLHLRTICQQTNVRNIFIINLCRVPDAGTHHSSQNISYPMIRRFSRSRSVVAWE